MQQGGDGAWEIFQVRGIHVRVHWSWTLIVVALVLSDRTFDSYLWATAFFLSLFAIVLLHEFGHAFACRSVGGVANRIVLWPLGGIAFVRPPQRPGPMLWSVAAGPLVNVLLVPVTFALVLPFAGSGVPDLRTLGDPQMYLWSLLITNMVILLFNILPIYPLDGGQILQALLWFVLGQARSLQIASAIGLVAAGALALFAFSVGHWLLLFIAVFVAFQAWNGYRVARMMLAAELR